MVCACQPFYPNVFVSQERGRCRPCHARVSASAPRATWSCIDDLFRSPVALALRVYPPVSRVGPSGIACSALLAYASLSAPRPSIKLPRMLDEPLGSPLPSTSLLHLSILRTGSKQLLNEPDPLSLRSDESVASSFALLHLLKPLFMGFERLANL